MSDGAKAGMGCLIGIVALLLLCAFAKLNSPIHNAESTSKISKPSLADAEQGLLSAAQSAGMAQVNFARQIIALVRNGQPFAWGPIDGAAAGLFRRDEQARKAYLDWKEAVIREAGYPAR